MGKEPRCECTSGGMTDKLIYKRDEQECFPTTGRADYWDPEIDKGALLWTTDLEPTPEFREGPQDRQRSTKEDEEIHRLTCLQEEEDKEYGEGQENAHHVRTAEIRHRL